MKWVHFYNHACAGCATHSVQFLLLYMQLTYARIHRLRAMLHPQHPKFLHTTTQLYGRSQACGLFHCENILGFKAEVLFYPHPDFTHHYHHHITQQDQELWRSVIFQYNQQRYTRLLKVATSGLIFLVVGLSGSCSSQVGYCKSKTLTTMSTAKIPTAFIPHGGGPLPILGDQQHVSLVNWLSKFVDTYLTGDKKPSSALIISAHWESRKPTVQSGATTKLFYDYYGFAEESYHLKYTLKGATSLSKRVGELLRAAEIPFEVDETRGYDHGVFIPMKILYPEGNIPTIQLSLVKGLDPKTHIKLGEALAPLREEGVFILGSGMSYHNMAGFRHPNSNRDSESFHEFLRTSLTKGTTYEDRVAALEKWSKAPKARECHPREEHLMPLHVILGTTKDDENDNAKEEFFADVAGVKCAGYVFH